MAPAAGGSNAGPAPVRVILEPEPESSGADPMRMLSHWSLVPLATCISFLAMLDGGMPA